jgi:hypothetical protein
MGLATWVERRCSNSNPSLHLLVDFLSLLPSLHFSVLRLRLAAVVIQYALLPSPHPLELRSLLPLPQQVFEACEASRLVSSLKSVRLRLRYAQLSHHVDYVVADLPPSSEATEVRSSSITQLEIHLSSIRSRCVSLLPLLVDAS